MLPLEHEAWLFFVPGLRVGDRQKANNPAKEVGRRAFSQCLQAGAISANGEYTTVLFNKAGSNPLRRRLGPETCLADSYEGPATSYTPHEGAHPPQSLRVRALIVLDLRRELIERGVHAKRGMAAVGGIEPSTRGV